MVPVLVLLAAEVGDARDVGQHRSQEVHALGLDLRPDNAREPRDIAAGSREALHEPFARGIDADRHSDGDGSGYCLGCPRQLRTAGHDHVRFEANQLGDDVVESLVPTLGRPALQDEILAFYIAEGPQALHQRSPAWADRLGPSHLRNRLGGGDEADVVNLPRLLCLGGERCGERPSQRGQQEAAAVHHSIT
jgi:hypothetical protein